MRIEHKTIHLPRCASEKCKTPEAYQQWLESLPDNSPVAFQEFLPASDSPLAYPFETWRYTLGRIIDRNRFLPTQGSGWRCLLPDGRACYIGSEKEWGEVFPARVVPLSHDLQLPPGGHPQYADEPVYEPLFMGCYRHVYRVDYGPLVNRGCNIIRRTYPYHYQLTIDNGFLFHCFSPDEAQCLKDGAKRLYSKWID